MELVFYFAVPLLAVIALLWVINRRNPGNFRMKDANARDQLWQNDLFHGTADRSRWQRRS